MPNAEHTYIAIDLKSFFASVECVERGLNPLTTHLVVADKERTEKTICLAVSPSLKAHGVGGRARLFEVVERVRAVNAERRAQAPGGRFTGKSHFAEELTAHPDLALDYIIAPPRMARYIDYSTRVYGVYLNYIAPEDIHVYSIDEVFMDVTHYLATYRLTAHELAMRMIRDVLRTTGITATAGIGTNLYLCKVAMDIVAKHIAPDADGVRIAHLDEMTYRRTLWDHRPLTDFWRVGRGIARRLEGYGVRTMGDLARLSLTHEEFLFKLFGVNAELLIDHAWGHEPCTIEAIKAYRPETNSLSRGQVLHSAYTVEKARTVIHEMAEEMALTLLSRRLVTDRVEVHVGYDRESLTDERIALRYDGPVAQDHYGRLVPKPVHAGERLDAPTSSARVLSEAVLRAFDRAVNPDLLVRRLNLTAAHVVPEPPPVAETFVQRSLFDNYEEEKERWEHERAQKAKERRVQEAMLSIKQQFGKNAILKGLNFAEGATAKERNGQIGGHRA